MGTDTRRLLVAAPGLPDPNFETAVVLLLEHGEGGALGVVLNRPSDVTLSEMLDVWRPYAAAPQVIFVGGPVDRDAVLALTHVHGDEVLGVRPVTEEIGLVDLELSPVAAGVRGPVRVFAGYAGWGAGQLEAELEAGTWFVVDAHPDDVFSEDPEGLWRSVLVRQGGVFATVTPDPTSN